MDVRKITVEEFHAELQAQGMPCREHLAFVCPMCGTVQAAHDLINAGAGGSFEEVERFLGFSCVGRWTNAPAPRGKADGKPCNWTLGGLFQVHQLEVITPDGERHRRFETASAQQAQALLNARAGKAVQ
jgi:hypothetical protein